MRAVNYFKNRFDFAVKNSGTIKVNQNDIDALNDIINFANTNSPNTQLEDSLLLFWIFSYWTVDIENQKLKKEPKHFLELTDLTTVLNKLCTRLRPKDEMIKKITLDLHLAQLECGIPKEKLIPETDVSETMENLLQKVKTDFSPISDLNKCDTVKYVYPEMTERQNEMFSKFKLININSADHILHYLLNFAPTNILDQVRKGLC